MNIFQSIHPIHITDAFSRAETQLRVGTLQSRDIGSGCGQNPVPPSSFNGLEKLQELLSMLQSFVGSSSPPGNIPELSLFLAYWYQQQGLWYTYKLPAILHRVLHLLLPCCEESVSVPVLC